MAGASGSRHWRRDRFFSRWWWREVVEPNSTTCSAVFWSVRRCWSDWVRFELNLLHSETAIQWDRTTHDAECLRQVQVARRALTTRRDEARRDRDDNLLRVADERLGVEHQAGRALASQRLSARAAEVVRNAVVGQVVAVRQARAVERSTFYSSLVWKVDCREYEYTSAGFRLCQDGFEHLGRAATSSGAHRSSLSPKNRLAEGHSRTRACWSTPE